MSLSRTGFAVQKRLTTSCMASVVERAAEEARALLEAREHHFEVDVAPGLLVDGDGDRLVQVVTNLLTNAAKYTPESGHLRLSAKGHDGQVVLRVEDAAMMLGELLSGIGWEVMLAKDGPEALESLDRFNPDVALLDIGLPIMDGYELAAKIRERLGEKTPKMIAISGYGQETDRTRCRERGFDAHLVKPVDWEELLQAIGGS